MNRLIIATHNVKKAGEMCTILAGRFPQLELRTLADYPNAPEPEETGDTYAANAIIKAESAVRTTGEWCVADDAGLEIDALPGDLGVQSKRFAGPETTFEEKMEIILSRMVGVENRAARFRCCVALAGPEYPVEVLTATCEGEIGHERRGSGGFGYDPIFWLPKRGCTMAELTAEQKHAISHRGKVLALLAQRLDEIIAGS